MQQKIQFVATVLHQPKLIILDEPFSGFDPINANIIKDEILQLKEAGSSIIFSTHRMESVEELCDHVALIHKSKKLLDGSKEELKDLFKDNTYTVSFRGEALTDQDGMFGLVDQQKNKEITTAVIKLAEDIHPKKLITYLNETVDILNFSENIPSMNEIFIRSVQNGIPEKK